MLHVPSQVLKAVSRAASRELGRYMIDGINLRADGTVEATDGRWTLRGRATVDAEKSEFKGRIMAQEAAQAILRDPLVKRTKSVSIQSNGTFTYWGSAGEAPAESRDAQFPDTDGVIPEKKSSEETFVVCVSAEILAALAAAAKDVQPDNPCVRFQFQNDPKTGKPAANLAIRVDIGEGERALSGCAMPMSL